MWRKRFIPETYLEEISVYPADHEIPHGFAVFLFLDMLLYIGINKL